MHFHAQSFLNLIIVLVCSSARSHDAQILRSRAIPLHMFRLQPPHELDARIDFVRLEFEEVEAAAEVNVTWLVGEVDEFG
jgi:hypothetical protein